MTLPYTYLIKNLTTGKIYYGCQYSKDCHPDNLWKTYFTSSQYVRELIDIYGKEDFVYEIRKTFNSKSKAVQWERKVLRRLNASFYDIFLNKNNGGLTSYSKHCWIKKNDKTLLVDEYCLKDYLNDGWVRGRYFSDEIRKKISNSKKGQKPAIAGKTMTEEQRNRISQSKKGCKSKSFECTIYGTTYPSMKEAMKQLNLSRYHIKKIITNT